MAVERYQNQNLDQLSHSISQFRDYRLFEPGVSLHPDAAAPTWMRQWKELITVLRKCFDGFRHRDIPPRAQIISVSVLTDQERQLQIGKMLKQALVPTRCTLGTRRVVASILPSARITKPDREDRHSRIIVERHAIQIQPVAQAIAACIIPRYPTLMNLAPWRLTDDQKSSGLRQLYNGPRTERQFCLADPTGPNFAQ